MIRQIGEEGEDSLQGLLQFLALDHKVHLAMILKKLGTLEAIGERLSDRLRDHPGAGKADEGARLSQDQVAEHRHTGRYPARGGIRQDREVEDALLSEEAERRGCLRHLHARENPLLHSGPARRRNNDEGVTLLERQLGRARELLADDRAHAAAHELELEDRDHDWVAFDATCPGDDRVLKPGLLLRCLEAIAIALGVLEAKRILRAERAVGPLKAPVIKQERQPLPCADPERIAALGTDATGALHLSAIDDLFAGITLDPEPLGDDLAR